MPNIKLVNIRFRLDGDVRDRQIHDALFQYPDGARNQIVKEALHMYLIGDGPKKSAGMPTCSMKAKADTEKQGVSNQDNHVKAEKSAATADTPAEAATDDSAADSHSIGSGDEAQIIAGLQSMIL